MGTFVRVLVGNFVGLFTGLFEEGDLEGAEGRKVGDLLGTFVTVTVGARVGARVGANEGELEGRVLGCFVGLAESAWSEGAAEGLVVVAMLTQVVAPFAGVDPTEANIRLIELKRLEDEGTSRT